MLTVTEARNIINEKLPGVLQPITERRGLLSARNLVLAGTIVADRDVPPFNRATMDGYALRSADLRADPHVGFKITGTVHAGSSDVFSLGPGECVKIMTGAPVPVDADAVIRIEDSEQHNSLVHFRTAIVEPYKNIARRGEDSSEGAILVSPGRICDVSVLTVAAAFGYENLEIFAPPTVVIITTGNEIVEPGEKPAAHQIRNTNMITLASMLDVYGIKCETAQVCDDRETLKKAIERGFESHIMILTGGVSMGETDYVPEVLESLGVIKWFHKLKIRPGKPIWVGAGDGCLVFGLPGNPFSARVGCKVFIEPIVRQLLGLKPHRHEYRPLSRAKIKKHDFEEYFRCGTAGESNHYIEIVHHNGSGDFIGSLRSDGIALHPAEKKELEAGEEVLYIPW